MAEEEEVRRGGRRHFHHHDGGGTALPPSLRENYSIEELPARREADMMREQGERAAGLDVPTRTTYRIGRINPHRRISRRTT